jgi:hypothetical protein
MRKICILFLLFALFESGFSQQKTGVLENDINKNIEGAVYKFSFAQVTDTHIGESAENGDYGTSGFDDEPPVGDIGNPAIRLRRVVDWLNDNAAEKGIDFVIVSGDLTDSGEKSEFYKFKEIMSTLNIPYVPMIGNHDVWPYTKQEEATHPYGDSLMNEIFEDVYESAKSFFDTWDDGTRTKRTWNPEGKTFNYLQNFSFTYKGFNFVLMDFNPRYHTPKNEPGIGPEAQLMNFKDGSWEWVTEKLNSITPSSQKDIFMISHHPPAQEFWAFYNAFDIPELIEMNKLLEQKRDNLAYWLGGHIHRNFTYQVNTPFTPKTNIICLETRANKELEHGMVRIVHVYGVDEIPTNLTQLNSNLVKVYPNPTDGIVKVSLETKEILRKVEIFNQAGQLMTTTQHDKNRGQKQFTFDLSILSKGVYVLHLVFDNNFLSKQVVLR